MNRYRRRGIGVAALLTALAALLALLTSPAAATAAPAPAAKPKPALIGSIVVPAGTTQLDADQAAAYAAQAMDDPLLRRGVEARDLLGAPANGRKNGSVMWFDVSQWPFPLDQKTLDTLTTKNLVTRDPTHKMRAEWLEYEGNEALFKRLGLGQGARVLEFAATNVGEADVPVQRLGDQGFHAEELMLLQLERALRILGYASGRRLSDQQIDALMRQAARAIYSDRQNCVDICAPKVKDLFPADRNVALVRWDTAKARAAAARLVAALVRASKARIEVLKVEEDMVRAIVAKDEPALEKAIGDIPARRTRARELKALMSPNDCGGTGTPAVGRGPVGGGGAGVLGMAAPMLHAAAVDCGGSKAGASSPLGRLLAAPVPADKYGGVDFSTLELRYVSDTDDGVRYSYSADALPGGFQQDQALGSRVVQLTAADLRTWLVLDPTTFWVNLDPQEPDRIIDPELGKTNAGRALLEADLAMKRTSGKLINPRTAFGKRYWDAMTAGSTDTVCFSSRVWIVPGQVRVREDGSSLYVLQADLDVKTESELGRGFAADCPAVDPATDQRRERVERELVLPQIVKAVNTAPEYAPLRRAFLARVVAQWIRQRHDAGRRTSYDDVIGTGRLGAAELRDGWKPRQVYDDFLKSWNQKEFSYSITSRQGNTVTTSTFVFGGVDWSKLRYDGVSEDEMKARYGHVADTVKASADRPATAPDGSIWLGDTVPGPERGTWDRAVGRVTGLADGRLGVALIVVVAVVALAFGFRGPRRRTTPPPPSA